jgi:DNA invertase Pin-like site-specific DNA recombinase
MGVSHWGCLTAKGLTGNAVAYIRVSTGKQAKSGLGLDAQIEAIRAFAKAEGYRLTGTFEEHESGKGAEALDRRPQLAAAIKARRRRLADRLLSPSSTGSVATFTSSRG